MAFDWRKRLLTELGRQRRDMKEVSLTAGLGETYVRDALKRDRGGKVENLRKIAVALGRSEDWLLGADNGHDTRGLSSQAGAIKPAPEFFGKRDLPIYVSAEGGPGEIIRSAEPIEYFLRPHTLIGSAGAYGIYIIGDSMWPAYRRGDIAWVDPRLPLSGDEEAIFYAGEYGLGETRATIKTLLRATTSNWAVRQLNPPMDFSLPRGEWMTAHRVVGKFSRKS